MVAPFSRPSLLAGAACLLCALAGCGSRAESSPDDDSVVLPADELAAARGVGSEGSSGEAAGMPAAEGQEPADVDEPPAVAQGCRDGGVLEGDFTLRDDVDFAQLEGCSELRGNLLIQITKGDLAPLQQLRKVTGSLHIGSGPPSLAGLENLSEVKKLFLDWPRATSLQSLAGLQRVSELSIEGDVPQGNLDGLGGIVDLQVLTISGSSLPSLAGLVLPARMASVSISNSATSDLSGLAGVTQLGMGLALTNVRGLTSLHTLTALVEADTLSLVDNPDLVAVAEPPQLTQMPYLFVQGNARLEQLPALARLSSLVSVEIRDNPALRSLPSFAGAATINSTIILGNAALERIELPGLGATIYEGYTQGSIVIAEHPLLTQISLPALTRTATLTIVGNAALADVDVPLLELARERLVVAQNAELSSAELGTLLTAETPVRKVGGNRGDAPLESCPWTNDGYCDEATNLCAAGDDAVDCNDGALPW